MSNSKVYTILFKEIIAKMKNLLMKGIYIVTVLCFCSVFAFGQNTKRADKAFEMAEYYKAIEEYTLLLDQIQEPAQKSLIRYRIAESYRRMNYVEKAEKYYVEAIKAGFMSPEIYMGYGISLLKQGKYEEAGKAFETYKRSSPGDKYVDILLASVAFAKANQTVNPNFVLQPLETLNTQGSEYGIAYFNDALIYASTGNPYSFDKSGEKKKNTEISLRTGQGYSKFYMSVPINGQYETGELAVGLNSKEKTNQGTFSYDPTAGLGYYTRCEGKDNNCYIYFAEFKNNQWKEKDRLLIESRKMAIAHPFITPDGRRIYFTSAMEGGYGRADLWYMDKLPDGKWSKPINLGREVNTIGNEYFPFVAGDYLFFASDGHPGYGGLDIFASKIDGNIHGPVVNIGLPFNSSADDLNLIMRLDLEEGMLVSSRRNEKSSDDIFKFKGFPSAIIASGRLYDSVSNEGLVGVAVEVISGGKTVDKLTTADSGRYSFYVSPATKYELKTAPEGFNPTSRTYTSPEERFASAKDWNLSVTSSEAYISGIVTTYKIDQKTKKRTDFGPKGGVVIALEVNGKQVKIIRSKANGEYRFGDIKENTHYTVKAVLPNHFVDSKNLSVGKIIRSIDFNKASGHDMNLALEEIPKEEINIENIYYDFGKATLRPEAEAELDRLIIMLNKNPQLNIQISSHTDAKGSVKSNDKLSEDRAKSVVDYLIRKGVSSARLQSKGYGKRQLLIKNAKTEEQHQINRRTTFKIVGESGASLYDTSMQISESVEPGVRRPSFTAPQSTNKDVKIATNQNQEVDYSQFPFRIQLSASRTLNMANPEFARIQTLINLPVYNELSGGWYRYYVGGFNTLEEAKTVADKINKALGTQYFPKAK